MSSDVTIEQILEWSEMADVKEELEDPKYSNRRHMSRATYALGCHGPLCRKAERMRGRDRNESAAQGSGRDYTPSDRRMYDRDALLDAIFQWHIQDLALRRIAKDGARQ